LRGKWSKRLLRTLELLKWHICKLNSSIPVNNTKWVLDLVLMVDIWGHGSNGSLINMVYNTYYGMGYNNTILTKSRFEMNSYSTQVAHLLFEYV
jgi:hypothetical protein